MQQQRPKPQVRERFSQESDRPPSQVPSGWNLWSAPAGPRGWWICGQELTESLGGWHQFSLEAGLNS